MAAARDSDGNAGKYIEQQYSLELFVLIKTDQGKCIPDVQRHKIEGFTAEDAKMNSYHYLRQLEQRGYLDNAVLILCYLRNSQNTLLKKYKFDNSPANQHPYR